MDLERLVELYWWLDGVVVSSVVLVELGWPGKDFVEKCRDWKMDLGVYLDSMTSWVGRMLEGEHHEHVRLGKCEWKQDRIGQRSKDGAILKADARWGGCFVERRYIEVNPVGRIG
jgi:hypothetical protein